MNEWFSRPFDCYFKNPIPDWGQPDNPEDNPFLDLDDFSGNGPENLSLRYPEDVSREYEADYKVGVHFYSQIDRIDGFQYGSVNAFLRIFIDGELAWDYSDEDQPGFKEMQAEGHFWEAVGISWPEKTVHTLDVYYEETPMIP